MSTLYRLFRMKLFPKTIISVVPLFTMVLILSNAMALHVLWTPESEVTLSLWERVSTTWAQTSQSQSPGITNNEQKNSPNVDQPMDSDIEGYFAFALISVGLTVFFLILILYLIVHRFVIRPISYLRHASEEVSKGNFNISLNTNKTDEISSLSRSFLEMCLNLKNSNSRVHRLAFFDEITNLPNRRSYNLDIDRITASLIKDRKCAVMLIDLDHFKEINDIHGHATGDKLLKNVADRLVEKTKHLTQKVNESIESYVYRIAGDEFIVLLNNLSSMSEAVNIANSIQDSLATPMIIDGKSFNAKSSMGVSAYPLHSINSDFLFQYADMAMYEAKKQGRGKCCVFDDDFLKKIVLESDMEKDIRNAIANEEFYLVFQPKYSVKEKRANEFEALIRWAHPEKGNISPGVFIPFAEDRNLINEIGVWVIENLCKTIKSLEQDGWMDFRISFNTSPKQLQDIAFMRHLEYCIETYCINPRHLEMEITEHSIARDFDKTILALEHVRNLGMTIAIDDFGTGYSSLSYLRRMPINIIKIDKVFVSEALKNPKSRTVVETILTLANGLGMKTVAEGVETQDEFAYVQEQGCDYVQGYYFSKPIGISEMCAYKSQSKLNISFKDNLQYNKDLLTIPSSNL